MASIVVTAHLESPRCELFLDGGEVFAYLPTKDNAQAILGLNVGSYVDAEVKARSMGLEPEWN